MRFKKVFSNLEPEGRGHGIVMGVTGLLLLEILHHTDPKGPNISGGGVLVNGNKAFTKSNEITLGPEKSTYSVFL